MLDRWNKRMYALICKNQQLILTAIEKDKGVPAYELLVSNIGRANDPQYQDKYKDFWMMKRAHLGSSFDRAYFSALNPNQPMPSLRNLCQVLYQFPRLRGDQALQFSFATKLRHMLNRQLPIYDDRVASFYLFQAPPALWCKSVLSANLRLRQRINGLIVFHNFLIHEYRVVSSGVLAGAIAAFRQRFNDPRQHTDVKIIDWLIYEFVRLANQGKIAW